MLELSNVSAGYGTCKVLDNVTASFSTRELISIIGVNGSGKSTLLKVILGVLPFYHGEIDIDGQGLRSLNRNEVAKKIAYLSQGKNTPDMTVEQLVLHGRFPHLSYPRRYTQCDKKIASDAMEAVGIADLAHKKLCTLSGGMRQNAYIAMALAQDTDYILLDEPTTYLDITHQFELMNLIRGLADKGKGIIAVMHDLPMAFNFSDRIFVIDKGQVKAFMTPQELSDTSIIGEVFNVKLKRMGDNGSFFYDI